MKSAITTKGHLTLTIPKAIRDDVQLEPCESVKFFVHPDGATVLLPKGPVSVLLGIIAFRRPP